MTEPIVNPFVNPVVNPMVETIVEPIVEPIGIQNLFLGTMSGALVVLMGAFYALFFALGRLHGSTALNWASLFSYVLLAGAVYVLVISLEFSGIWIGVATVMLIGYFLAPRAIWHLCVGTHAGDEADMNNGVSR